ncbi:hypothetical protein SZ54_3527 [Rhizobium sp. UR51a]|nr:hypothetical protein SZ54_3527 [Rhizobium sp. UR51a]
MCLRDTGVGDIPDCVLPVTTFRLHATRFRITCFWKPNPLCVRRISQSKLA